MVDYSPLWETLKKKNISTYCLIKDYHFSKGTLDALKHNRNVNISTLETLCRILDVPIEQIVVIYFDQNKKDRKKIP